ncbi:MAG: hypothetical protein O3A96_14815 [Proteobacteria bacterium]|nr:hypothetical protein [Pseudomonadota bacterium]
MVASGGRFGRVLAFAFLSAALVAAGCQTAGDSGRSTLFGDSAPLTPAEQQMRNDADVFNETVFGGAVAGMAMGGLFCAMSLLLGSNQNNMAVCATAIGVGAALGAIDGYMVATRQEAARRQVREIDVVTEDIEQSNAKLRKLVASSQKVVEQNRERINEVTLKVAQNQARAEELTLEQARLDDNIAVMSGTLENLREERDGYVEVAGELASQGQDTTRLRAQLVEMNRQIAALEQERDALENINRASKIG